MSMTRSAHVRISSLTLMVGLASALLDPQEAAADPAEQQANLTRTLADAFRIDLLQIDVEYDLHPAAPTLEGRAELSFRMRPGQERALFHFDPRLDQGTVRGTLRTLRLNGEPLDPMDDADLRVTRFDGSKQDAFELQRDLSPDAVHVLIVEWSIWNLFTSKQPGWFRSLVNDTPGRGNEMFWPTINSPEEQARHTLEVRIHDEREYLMIGSGAIWPRRENGTQIWSLDTERAISSHTVMFAVMPREEVIVELFDAGSVPVVIASTVGRAKTDKAVERTKKAIAQLEHDFGPFPMPSMQILLIGGGMEYYGATVTGLGALVHELGHMYWGTSAVLRTYRDGWLDEALVTWWEEGLSPLAYDTKTDIVGGRAPIRPGFDGQAYGKGGRAIKRVASELGGRAAMNVFLADLYRRRAFEPFTTEDFIDDLIEWTGEESWRADFHRWLYPVVVGSRKLEGVWQRRGYGEILEIDDRRWREYETTALSCLQVDSTEEAKARKQTRGMSMSEREDRLSFGVPSDLNRFQFLRDVGGLPPLCQGNGSRSSDPVYNFDVFWQTFAENYPFFEERGIDWDARYAQIRPLIDQNTSNRELTQRLVELALPLNDGHASLRGDDLYTPTATEQRLIDEWAASGAGKGFGAFLRSERGAFDRLFEARYLPAGLRSAARGLIHWGRMSPQLGYLRFDEMEGLASGGVKGNVKRVRRIMRRVVRDFAGVEAVIIDLRWNGGGFDEVGLAVAGFFSPVPRTAFAKRPVEGADVGPAQTLKIWPQSDKPLLVPVFVLTSGFTASAAEVFNIALRSRGQVIQVGEPSMGALSDILDRTLPNGWSFSLSNEIYLDPDGALYEGVGLPVDIEADFFAPTDRRAGIDPAIEAVFEAMAGGVSGSARAR